MGILLFSYDFQDNAKPGKRKVMAGSNGRQRQDGARAIAFQTHLKGKGGLIRLARPIGLIGPIGPVEQ
jgi:hypothetical protein